MDEEEDVEGGKAEEEDVEGGGCGEAGGGRRTRGTPGHLSLSTLWARRTDYHVDR